MVWLLVIVFLLVDLLENPVEYLLVQFVWIFVQFPLIPQPVQEILEETQD